ncbi:copper resistance protein NlpE [Dysgonomonas sp. Marseille-P4361]|uniref:copper resistance protein NlpE n=1 Tax=Dysgonomonas sp. Marseille-P4361 TaxID=2161820 RepID=UPI000D54DF50|nr:copper resistance protein NlpE N-terminal domain-containing protein [Dysgonomonas sp. Marseille-P4361]
MKQFLIAIASVFFLISCVGGQKVKEEQVEEQASVSEFEAIAEGIDDGHSARVSLDYQGTYTGKIPAADAPGINVVITLSDSTYVKTMEFEGKKDSKSEYKGKYEWNKAGNTITLFGTEREPDQFFVGENTLIMLDMEGKRITGDLAEHYILNK